MPNDEYVDYYGDEVDTTDPLHPNQNTFGYEMKVAEELRDQIDRYGHWLAVRQVIPSQSCPCMRNVSEGPEPNCRICHGDGKLFVDHIVRGRVYTPKPQIGAETHVPIGQMYIHSPMFMLEPGVVTPKLADFILELVIDYDTNEPMRPYQIRNVFKIVNVAEMRDLKGKIAFFQIKCEKEAWEHPE